MYIQSFPDVTGRNLDTSTLYDRWRSTYTLDYPVDQIDRTRLEAKCFLQPGDLKEIFNELCGSDIGSRAVAEAFLDESDKTWLLRKGSVIDTEFEKAYVLSFKIMDGSRDGDRYNHTLIVHCIGDCFYFGVTGIGRGESAGKQMEKFYGRYASIVSILEDLEKNDLITLRT